MGWPVVTTDIDFTTLLTTAPAAWTDVSNRNLGFSCSAGRQYELATPEAGEASVAFRNNDEALSPLNTSSSYGSANLVPYRPLRIRAVWNSVTYGVFQGNVEQWPNAWDAHGAYGMSRVTCVDALALLGRTELLDVLAQETIADNPYYYWPLRENPSLTTGPYGNQIYEFPQSFGSSTYRAGTPYPLAAWGPFISNDYQPAQTWFTPAQGTIGVDGVPGLSWIKRRASGSVGQAGQMATGVTSVTVPGTAGGYVEMWIVPTQPSSSSVPEAGLFTIVNGSSTLECYITNGTGVAGVGNVAVGQSYNAPTYVQKFLHPINVMDGEAHCVGVRYDGSGNACLWVDGVPCNGIYATGSTTLVSTGFTPTANDNIDIGRSYPGGWTHGDFGGVMGNVAIYTSSIPSNSRIIAHAQAGLTGFSGESSGSRISRLLGYLPWLGSSTSIASGYASMAAAKGLDGANIRDAVYSAVSTEGGIVYVAGDGTITTEDRNAEYSTLTSTVTFGDNGTTDIPYQDDVEYRTDPQYLYNEAVVSRTGGLTVTVVDSTSQGKYLVSSFSKTLDVDNDREVADLANWIVFRYKDPQTRLAQIIINAHEKDAAWPVVLGAVIGQRVTVKRRAFSGAVVNFDYFIEHIDHDVDGAARTWVTTFSLSPAVPTAKQPFLLDNATYGKLNTGILGY